MRIALFTDTFPPQVNGVANTVERYATTLSEQGHEVCVFTVSSLSAEKLRQRFGDAFKVYVFPSIPALIYPELRACIPFVKGFNAVKMFNPDIIHTHTPFGVGWNAVHCARKLRVPLVGTHHTFFDHYLQHIHLDFAWARTLTWKLTVMYYDYCNVVVSPTRSLKESLQSYGLTAPVELLPNILDTDFFAPTPTQHHNARGNTLVYMGRLSYEKSVDDVIRIAKLVTEHLPDMRLIIIGDGPERGKLERQVNNAGLTKQIHFTGYLHGAELVQKLQEADVFITGSKSENMPLALMEAMAVGLPIVAVRSLGLEEMLRHEENAYLVAPNNLAECAACVVKLLQDESLRDRFSKTSRELALSYAQNAVIQRVVDLYERVSARGAS